MKHVTDNSEAHLERNPFPELHRQASHISDTEPVHEEHPSRFPSEKAPDSAKPPLSPTRTEVEQYRINEQKTEEEVKHGYAEKMTAQAEAALSESSGEVCSSLGGDASAVILTVA